MTPSPFIPKRRRQFYRGAVQLPTTLRLPEVSETLMAMAVDLSGSGMRLVLDDPLGLAPRLKLLMLLAVRERLEAMHPPYACQSSGVAAGQITMLVIAGPKVHVTFQLNDLGFDYAFDLPAKVVRIGQEVFEGVGKTYLALQFDADVLDASIQTTILRYLVKHQQRQPKRRPRRSPKNGLRL